MLGAKFASPLYVTVSVCVPTERSEVLDVAVPLASGAGACTTPSNVAVTVHVGVPPPPATVTVKVTLCPTMDGLRLEIRAVVVSAAS